MDKTVDLGAMCCYTGIQLKGEAVMKTAFLRLSVALVIVGMGTHALQAAPPQVVTARKALRGVPAAELPAQAAQLVSQAAADERDATAASVVTAALDLRPASTLAVVGAIAQQVPEVAPTAAAKAAALQPKRLGEIAAAAAKAAPAQAGRIVEALCKVAPASYAVIAGAVGGAVPSARAEILAALKTAVPGLKPFVERATSDLGQDAALASVLTRMEWLVSETARAAKTTPEKMLAGGNAAALAAPLPPPTVGPPFTPLPPGTDPGTVTRSMTRVAKPGGGRDYSGP
ncbi:MAG: hypothetical protein N3I86_15290 [Verrucomicrobiae bacterium]|nr:hypothetical protein [Verrucomicrobiae bacterium]